MKTLSAVTLIIIASTGLTLRAGTTWAERAAAMNRVELSAGDAAKRATEEEKDQRNKLSMRLIKPALPTVDWNADPTALPYMLYQINKRTDLPVYVDTEGLDVATDQLFDHTVTYLTAHVKFSFNDKESENLARWLKRGGTLFLDDCYNRGSPFATSVRPEVSRMIPSGEPVLLLEEDPKVTDVFKMTYQTPFPGSAPLYGSPWQYFLLDDRPCVFFSPNDDGCGWEISTPPSASNPIGEGIGHGGDNKQREMMYQWVTNWMLFVYTH